MKDKDEMDDTNSDEYKGVHKNIAGLRKLDSRLLLGPRELTRKEKLEPKFKGINRVS